MRANSSSPSGRLFAWGVLACLLVLVGGCGQSWVQREARAMEVPPFVEGPALVVLPRTCVVDRDAYGPITSKRMSGPGARTSRELRRTVDAMVAGVQSPALPADLCPPSSSPSLPERPTAVDRISELRASDHLLGMMRERGVQHAVVIEIETTLVCAEPMGSGLYAGAGIGLTPHVVRDDCDEDDIRLSAIVFAADGSAVWAGSRAIEPGASAERAVERLLRRVPVPIPLRARG